MPFGGIDCEATTLFGIPSGYAWKGCAIDPSNEGGGTNKDGMPNGGAYGAASGDGVVWKPYWPLKGCG